MAWSPFKKKPKWAKKLFGNDENADEDINEDTENIELLEITHTKNFDLFKVDDDFKVVEVVCNLPMYVGDNVVEYMGIDVRGKSMAVLKDAFEKQKENGKVTFKVLRVNSPKRYLKSDVKVIFSIFLHHLNSQISMYLLFSFHRHQQQ